MSFTKVNVRGGCGLNMWGGGWHDCCSRAFRDYDASALAGKVRVKGLSNHIHHYYNVAPCLI